MEFKAVLSIVDKGVYATEDVSFFSFPTAMKPFRLGTVQDVVKALSMIKVT